jgi:hypothetical protein
MMAVAEARGGLVVGAFDASRAGDANITAGIYSVDCMSALTTNFPGTTFATSPTLTPEFLSGVDILILHPAKSDVAAITPLSGSEQTALVNFVKAGGRALLLAEGEDPFIPVAQTFMSPFGVTLVDDGLKGLRLSDSVAPTHPVMNGPFGEVDQVLNYGIGVFSDLGPYASPLAVLETNGSVVYAAIEAGALGPNSGRVVLMGDSTPFFDQDNGGFFGEGPHEDLFLNTIDYLATPEPSTLTLLGAAGAMGGVIAGIRRIRPARRST